MGGQKLRELFRTTSLCMVVADLMDKINSTSILHAITGEVAHSLSKKQLS
jgi:hypothetical protein